MLHVRQLLLTFFKVNIDLGLQNVFKQTINAKIHFGVIHLFFKLKLKKIFNNLPHFISFGTLVLIQAFQSTAIICVY